MRISTLSSSALVCLSFSLAAPAIGNAASVANAQMSRAGQLRRLAAKASFLAATAALGVSAHATEPSAEPGATSTARVDGALVYRLDSNRLILPAGLSYYGKLETAPSFSTQAKDKAGTLKLASPPPRFKIDLASSKNPFAIHMSPTETVRFKLGRHRIGVTYEWKFTQAQLF